ncbi:MAG TPA: biotin/lipoyl-containing protein, partial [Burkholderiales bacterium]|nr:biotin/lipoyl-containing protein [Burkholderiales bacterium]
MRVFKLPDLGEGLQEAEVVEWHVAPGQEVGVDQPLVSVETAKAIVDIPSPWPGKIARLYAKAGDVVQIGAPLIGFEGGEDAADAGTVVGAVQVGQDVVTEEASVVAAPAAVSIKAAPAVRALARQLQVDLSMVTPTGPDGAASAEDVRRAASMLAEI